MIRRTEYDLYIRSNKWQQLRKGAIERDGKRCTQCRSKRRLHVHHLVYPEVYGAESLSDLVTLCEDCHRVVHGGQPKGKERLSQHCKGRKFPKTPNFMKRASSIVKIYSPSEIAAYQQSHRPQGQMQWKIS